MYNYFSQCSHPFDCAAYSGFCVRHDRNMHNLYLIFTTELLSLFNKLNRPFVLVSWIMPIIIIGTHLLNPRSRNKIRLPNILFKEIPWFQLFMIAVIALILLTLAVTAFFSPPNTYDVLNTICQG